MHANRFLLGLADLAREVLDAVYPPVCWLCRRQAAVDGLGCHEHALRPCAFDPAQARCRGCALLLPAGMPAEGAELCATCRRSHRGYRTLLAWGPYVQPGAGEESAPRAALREWILALKHGGRADLALPLGALLAERLAGQEPGPAAVLVPVPMHPLRRLERGVDHARLLAGHAAGLLRLECLPLLRRRRWTPPQGAVGARSRAANVRGAFRARRRARSELAGRTVLLVDDVVTSGATVEACATELRACGSLSISVLCLARAEVAGTGGARPVDTLEARMATDA